MRWRIWPTMLVAALAAAISPLRAQGPLPLDPLTERERALADSIARADPRVSQQLRQGGEVVNIEFVAAKPADADPRADVPPRRHAEVLFFLRETNTGLAVLVDLERRQVVEVARAPGENVPISQAEVDRAARLALANPAVVRLFGDRVPAFRLERARAAPDTASTRIDAIRTLGAPGDPCYRRRCVVLFFRINNSYVHMNRVLVDLTSNRVIVREGVR